MNARVAYSRPGKEHRVWLDAILSPEGLQVSWLMLEERIRSEDIPLTATWPLGGVMVRPARPRLLPPGLGGYRATGLKLHF